ncbi:AAA family ATPase [Romboutsia ilealis]|uniref:AAA family ATPase n=1 Tax=Romboutsia ilealis TaxID=1115758 RepID=UPI00257069EB|nr:AAA family ATPase [Romboutsia ilealis]
MKPIKLEFSGLNSYIEKTTIDFEILMNHGIFGIFGDTGSGKSTILDAISLALYGEIPRNTQDYININCDKAIISYEFEIKNKYKKKRYRVSRTIVRSEMGTKTFKAKLSELKNNNIEEVLSEDVDNVNKKIINIIGLTFNDFTKAILLPQGRFNEFIKSTDSSKRDTLERVFDLGKYGEILNYKIIKREEIKFKLKQDLETELRKYEGVTHEAYANELREIESLKYYLKRKNMEFEIAQKKYKESEEIYENQNNLNKYEVIKKELELKSNDINIKRKQLENFTSAQQINPYINIVQSLKKKINENADKMNSLDKKLDILNQELVISKQKYEKSYKIKSENIPELSTEKIKIQRARELEKEIDIVDKELRQLKEVRDELNYKKHDLEKIKLEAESNKDIITNSLKELEGKIDKLKISAKLKRQIFKAYNYEKEYEIIFEDRNSKADKYKFIINKLDEYNLSLKYLQKDKCTIGDKLKDITIHYDSLLKKCPGKMNDVFIKNDNLMELKLKLNLEKEKEIKIDNLQTNLNKTIEQKHKFDREVNTLNDKLEQLEKEINYVEADISKLKYLNLAEELKIDLKENMPCPVCGSRNHEYITTIDNNKIAFNQKKLEQLYQEKNYIKNKLEDTKSKYIEQVCLEQIDLKEIKKIKSTREEIKSNDILKKIDEENRKVEVLKNSIQAWQKDKEDTEEKLMKLKDTKNSIEKDEIKITQNIIFYKQYANEIKSELDTLDEDLKNVKDNYIGLKSILKVSDLCSKIQEIKNNERILEELSEEYIKIKDNKANIENIIQKHNNSLYEINVELVKTVESHAEKKKSRDEKYKEVISITRGEDTLVLISNIDEEINRITYQEEKNKKILEEQKIEYERISSLKSNLEGVLYIEKEEYETQQNQLNQLLKDNKFESIYEVKRSVLDLDYIRTIQDEIMHYDDEMNTAQLKCKELKEKLCGRRIDKENFKSLKNNINIINEELIKIKEKISKKNNILVNLEKSLDIVDEINKDLDKINKDIKLLEELKDVVKDKQFVEYMSISRLMDICENASNRLAFITNGRYNLEFDKKLNFIVRDNFNNRAIRTIDTLSGGELFLTSLALAIGFSSQIQLKGNSILEVLFLDEGFGTLDDKTLKQTIKSLEEIYSKNLSIGIISHIKDLKVYIPAKIIVTSPTEKEGSKIKLEYN